MSEIDYNLLKQKIIKFASDIGVNKIGFTDAEPLIDHLPRLLERKEAGFKYAINEGDPVRRITPRAHMENAKSIISVAVAYLGMDTKVLDNRDGVRGRFSLISRGTDYHKVVRNKLEQIQEFILSCEPEAQVIIMVDKEEILEKALAVKAGLGWFGRNTLLITPEFGSLVNLGELLTNIPFPADDPIQGDCGSCKRCIKACPTKALGTYNRLDPELCVSSLSQCKSLFDRELRGGMGNTLYGCDICQLVCPYNKKQLELSEQQSHSDFDESYPLLTEIISLSNREFRQRFGETSGAWRGRTPIQRNAIIALGNAGSFESIPSLGKLLLEDRHPVIRGAAAWALGQIGTEEAFELLRSALKIELNQEVILEIQASLSGKQ